MPLRVLFNSFVIHAQRASGVPPCLSVDQKDDHESSQKGKASVALVHPTGPLFSCQCRTNTSKTAGPRSSTFDLTDWSNFAFEEAYRAILQTRGRKKNPVSRNWPQALVISTLVETNSRQVCRSYQWHPLLVLHFNHFTLHNTPLQSRCQHVCARCRIQRQKTLFQNVSRSVPQLRTWCPLQRKETNNARCPCQPFLSQTGCSPVGYSHTWAQTRKQSLEHRHVASAQQTTQSIGPGARVGPIRCLSGWSAWQEGPGKDKPRAIGHGEDLLTLWEGLGRTHPR